MLQYSNDEQISIQYVKKITLHDDIKSVTKTWCEL